MEIRNTLILARNNHDTSIEVGTCTMADSLAIQHNY